MINRYQGNSGKVSRYSEPGEDRLPRPAYSQKPPPSKGPGPGEQRGQNKSLLGGLENLGRMLPERIGELETEDIILLLILYLMYRESGDSELLIIMGAMFLL